MNDETPQSRRLRKFIPQPHLYAARYGNFTLTERDLIILKQVHRFRYLEARHIHALVPGSDQQITRRLQGLFHNKYLKRHVQRFRMRLDLEPGSPLTAYGLDSRGARALSEYSTGMRARQYGGLGPIRVDGSGFWSTESRCPTLDVCWSWRPVRCPKCV